METLVKRYVRKRDSTTGRQRRRAETTEWEVTSGERTTERTETVIDMSSVRNAATKINQQGPLPPPAAFCRRRTHRRLRDVEYEVAVDAVQTPVRELDRSYKKKKDKRRAGCQRRSDAAHKRGELNPNMRACLAYRRS